MFCENCGEKLKEGAEICVACGKVLEEAKAVEPKVETKTCTKVQSVKTTAQTFAIVGFVMSFLSIVVGVICSWIALVKIKYQENKELRSVAVAGVIIALVKLGVIVLALLIALLASNGAYYVL